MSSGEYSKADLVGVIKQVLNLIEECIRGYMKKSECKHVLQSRHNIDPEITEIVWRKIEKENEEFFRAYYGRLVLIEQIRKFNMLLEEQASRLSMMHTNDSSPSLNTVADAGSPKYMEVPSRSGNMQQQLVPHNFGSSIQPRTLGTGDVPFPAPQRAIFYGAGPSNKGFIQEPPKDAALRLVGREAGYEGNLEKLSRQTGDASENSPSREASNMLNLNEPPLVEETKDDKTLLLFK